VVDSASDDQTIETAKKELHSLVTKPALSSIPLLVLANKNDIKDARDVKQMIQLLDLNSLSGREVSCYSISAKNAVNIDKTLEWLIKFGKKSNSDK
jgi:ADP-ribosylation factor-like protein 8